MENLKVQSGRSMVEIIAVLAVIGVLTVGGVEGYSYAIKKNEANNVAEEVSILAHEVSQQMMRGHQPEDVTDLVKDVNDVKINVAKYNRQAKQYEKGGTQPDPENDDRFALEVAGLKPEVAKILLSSGLASEPGLQKIQQDQDGTIQDITGTQNLDETSGRITLGLVFSKDLSDTCPAGEYKVDNLCQEATGNNISSGDGVLQECGQATKPNAEHTKCVACEVGENCGCENNKISSGKGNCVSCVKNANCGENKWCDTKGDCFSCPDNGTCLAEKTGFTCNPGYKSDDNGKCVEIATDNCPSGTTYDENATNPSTALEDGHCACNDFSSNQCGLSYFCNFNEATNTTSGTGICSAVSNLGTTNVSSDQVNWYTAYSWCLGKGTQMMDITELECKKLGGGTWPALSYKYYYGYCCKFGTSTSTQFCSGTAGASLKIPQYDPERFFWLNDFYYKDNKVLYVTGHGYIDDAGRIGKLWALCK